MAQKPFLALVIPAVETTGQPPGLPPGQQPGQGQPGLPPGLSPPHVSPPIYIEPPAPPELPEGSRLVLVWNGEDWQWAVLGAGGVTQPIAPTPSPKR